MICNNCATYYRASQWNNTRFCNNCCQFDGDSIPEVAPTDEDLADEISRLVQDHGTSKTKARLFND